MNDLDIPENILGECFDNTQGALDDLNLDADLNNKEPCQAPNNSDFSANNSGSANVNNMVNNPMGNQNISQQGNTNPQLNNQQSFAHNQQQQIQKT